MLVHHADDMKMDNSNEGFELYLALVTYLSKHPTTSDDIKRSKKNQVKWQQKKQVYGTLTVNDSTVIYQHCYG
jgi:hypothetical protein